MPHWRPRLRRLWNWILPGVPIPLRVAPGFWWIARRDVLSDSLFSGTFETSSRAFLRSFLKPGMTMLDVGAHGGVYTMTAARLVSPGGRVVSFEPSPRERARLLGHLRLNGITNVTVEPSGVGAEDGDADLFVVEGRETGCNSLRQPPGERVRATRVPLTRLDTYVERHAIGRVDFIKMDIEGGERDALRGAQALFDRDRPILLCEIEPARIEPWGYDPREILAALDRHRYDWFSLDADGRLVALRDRAAPLSGEYVASPR
jgi:FkbM family methyltransferase